MNLLDATVEIVKQRVSNINQPITSIEKENIYAYTKEVYNTLKELDKDYNEYKINKNTINR